MTNPKDNWNGSPLGRWIETEKCARHLRAELENHRLAREAQERQDLCRWLDDGGPSEPTDPTDGQGSSG